jgi:molybdenum cofactor guanylyltransferase
MIDSADVEPPLWGLVLAGGSSRRMGREKAQIDYHGIPQAEWAQRLLAAHCERAFVSVAPEQAASGNYRGLPIVVDAVRDGGPACGLLAAWSLKADVAWLVVAADMPLLDDATLRELVAARDAAAVATVFRNAEGSLEPLCAIWEPRARPSVKAGGSLRGLLERSKVHAVEPSRPDRLDSANTPEEEVGLRARLDG